MLTVWQKVHPKGNSEDALLDTSQETETLELEENNTAIGSVLDFSAITGKNELLNALNAFDQDYSDFEKL